MPGVHTVKQLAAIFNIHLSTLLQSLKATEKDYSLLSNSTNRPKHYSKEANYYYKYNFYTFCSEHVFISREIQRLR